MAGDEEEVPYWRDYEVIYFHPSDLHCNHIATIITKCYCNKFRLTPFVGCWRQSVVPSSLPSSPPSTSSDGAGVGTRYDSGSV